MIDWSWGQCAEKMLSQLASPWWLPSMLNVENLDSIFPTSSSWLWKGIDTLFHQCCYKLHSFNTTEVEIFEMRPLSPWKMFATFIANAVVFYSHQKYLNPNVSGWSTLPNSKACTLLLLLCWIRALRLQDSSTLLCLKNGTQLFLFYCHLSHINVT